MDEELHRSPAELAQGLAHIEASPKDSGSVDLIVSRPAVNERKVLPQAQLDCAQGLLGDSWGSRPNGKSADGNAHPEMQLNIMNSRAIDLIAQKESRWPLAGDQFYVDFDLSLANLPAGTQLQIGTAVIEVTAEPHTGCMKFVSRFGKAAMEFVNSERGRQLNLRGINAKVISDGLVKKGDKIHKL